MNSYLIMLIIFLLIMNLIYNIKSSKDIDKIKHKITTILFNSEANRINTLKLNRYIYSICENPSQICEIAKKAENICLMSDKEMKKIFKKKPSWSGKKLKGVKHV